MWTTIYVAIGEEKALEIKEKLKAAGFLIKIQFLTLEEDCQLYEILGPEFEVEEIKEELFELGII